MPHLAALREQALDVQGTSSTRKRALLAKHLKDALIVLLGMRRIVTVERLTELLARLAPPIGVLEASLRSLVALILGNSGQDGELEASSGTAEVELSTVSQNDLDTRFSAALIQIQEAQGRA